MQTHFPSGDGSGLVLAPFRGVRYDLSRVGGLANVTSPPYDVIGPGTLDQLLDASPYNVVRLILPAIQLDPRAAGQVAAGRLRDWLADGVLLTDDEPALYVYEQRGPSWVQRGLIGLIGVGTNAILPHEGVMPGPVAGRRELMAATRSNLEPILLVYNGGEAAGGHGGSAGPPDPAGWGHAAGTAGAAVAAGSASEASRLVARVAAEREPLARAVTDDGVTHRFWALTDPGEHAAISADLAGRRALIADGHHRYAAYRQLRDGMHASGQESGPWDYGLAFLVDADAYPLRLGPIHRVIPHLAPADAARLAAKAFTVARLPFGALSGAVPGTAGDGVADGPGSGAADREFADAMRTLAEAGRGGTAFLLAGRDGFWLLTEVDSGQITSAMPETASPRWRALDASVMQQLLIGELWSIKDNENDVLISHDAAEAVQLAIETGGTAVLCNPMDLAAVMELAAHGERVPRKSTSFGPKPRTGLVLRTVGDES